MHEQAAQILKHFDLYKYFDFVAGCELDGTRSHKHEIIEYALENAGALNKREQAVMLGDRHGDITGAKKAGVASIGVLYGYGSREELESCDPDYLAESVKQLRKLLF